MKSTDQVISSNHVRSPSGQFRSGQVRSDHDKVRLCQVILDNVRSSQVRSDHARTGMSRRVRSCQNISVQVKSESGQVRLVQDKFKSGKIS